MANYTERKEQLTQQSEQAKALWLKCLGGIETLEALEAEETSHDNGAATSKEKPKKELATATK